MKENFSIPLNYKEGTFRADEITDFSGETIDVKYFGAGILYKYIVPKYDNEVTIYEQLGDNNPIVTATYDSNGIIKYMELYRNDRTDLMYINFPDRETAKENIWQYSCFWGDRISEKILERKEKIARIFVDYYGDYFSPSFLVNAYTPEEVQKVIDDYNKYIESKGEKYKRNHYSAEDNSGNYYRDREIMPDTETLRIMLMCIDGEFANELYGFAIYVMTERIKSIIDKLDTTEDFKFITEEYD